MDNLTINTINSQSMGVRDGTQIWWKYSPLFLAEKLQKIWERHLSSDKRAAKDILQLRARRMWEWQAISIIQLLIDVHVCASDPGIYGDERILLQMETQWVLRWSESLSKAEKLFRALCLTDSSHSPCWKLWHHLCPRSLCVLNVSERLTTLFKLQLWDSSFKMSDVFHGSALSQVPCLKRHVMTHFQSFPLHSSLFPPHCSSRSSYPSGPTPTAFLPLRSILAWSVYTSSTCNISLIWLWHDYTPRFKD